MAIHTIDSYAIRLACTGRHMKGYHVILAAADIARFLPPRASIIRNSVIRLIKIRKLRIPLLLPNLSAVVFHLSRQFE
jgi:hypothetical protein